MNKINLHPTKKWEISLITLDAKSGKKYKVTKRLPDFSVAETKLFDSQEEAEKQFEEWLSE